MVLIIYDDFFWVVFQKTFDAHLGAGSFSGIQEA